MLCARFAASGLLVCVCSEFVVKRQQSKTKTGGGIVIKTESVSAEKKARKKEKERKFWKKLGNVISEDTSAVWTALERGPFSRSLGDFELFIAVIALQRNGSTMRFSRIVPS